MKAIEVKRELDKKIKGVAKTIAFYYGEKYSQDILDSIDELAYYVYDNDDYQISRLRNIELVDIAKQFAKDVSENLHVNEKRREEIDTNIAEIILAADALENPKEYIESRVKKIKELKDNYLDYSDEFIKVLGYFQRDYEVKKITKIIDEAYVKNKQFENKTITFKREILASRFNFNGYLTNEECLDLWDLFNSFNPSVKKFMDNSLEYKKEVNSQRRAFYKKVGCKGTSLDDLMIDAQNKGLLVDENLFYDCINEYQKKFDDLTGDYYFASSNLDDIFNDLERKGYYCDTKSISTFIIETKNLCGVNFSCSDEFARETSFIIYNNNERLYSKDFNETFIHEIIHYIGGINSNIGKKGLHYNNDIRYLHLEEAYTNYVAKEITDEYEKNHGDLIEYRNDKRINSTYDCTLSYMKEVFKLYKEELFKIHLSTNISERAACLLMPYSEIADAVSRIKEAEFYNRDDIIKEEITKLSRRKAR